MTQTTSPDNLPSPDMSDQYALTQDFANLADATQNAFTRRGNMYVGTSAQRVAFTNASEGVHWQDTNGDRLEYVRRDGAWALSFDLPPRLPFAVAAGRETLSQVTPGATLNTEIVFPVGRFSQPPIVTATTTGNSPGASIQVALVTSVGFTLRRRNEGASNISIGADWHAIQMTSSSGAG